MSELMSHHQGDTGRKKIEPTEKKPEKYKLDKTYSLDFSEIPGFSGKHDFNAKDFFINEVPLHINDTVIKYNPEEKRVEIGNEQRMTVLEFLLKLNIGLHQGGFDIEQYVFADKKGREYLDDDNDGKVEDKLLN
jgi:hypothetical protein